MEQVVTVVALDGDTALVRGRRASACGTCAGKSACGTLGSWVERFAEMRARNPLHANVGDEVVVDVPDGLLLKAAFRLYGLPMLVFIVSGLFVHSVALNQGWGSPDLFAVFGAIAGMLACYAWLFTRYEGGRQEIEVSIVRIKTRGFPVPVHTV